MPHAQIFSQNCETQSYSYTNILHQGCTNPRCQVAWVTKFFMVVPNICESSVWNLLHVTLLVSQLLRWLLLKNLWPLTYTIPCTVNNQSEITDALSALIFSSLSNGDNLCMMLDNFLNICTIKMLICLMPQHQMPVLTKCGFLSGFPHFGNKI
jgi:hypothetical protein